MLVVLSVVAAAVVVGIVSSPDFHTLGRMANSCFGIAADLRTLAAHTEGIHCIVAGSHIAGIAGQVRNFVRQAENSERQVGKC